MLLIDLKMPEACDVCPMNYDFGFCKAFNERDDWEKYREDWNEQVCEGERRPAYCPLKEVTSEEAEWEGDPRNGYWPVCGACHGVIGTSDRFCRHCGAGVKWK